MLEPQFEAQKALTTESQPKKPEQSSFRRPEAEARMAVGETWLDAHSKFAIAMLLVFGLLLRLHAAWGTFLNPDEAMHCLAANKGSLVLAYQSSFTLAHPPLLVLLLYFWRNLGTSEFVLRLPSVMAGTAFCWAAFRWLSALLGRAVGCVGLIFVTFLPPLIALSGEIRQYALLLFFAASAAWLLEYALSENSGAKMLLSGMFLFLALLTHYSALLFAAALGVYGLLRLLDRRSPIRVTLTWAAVQVAALGLVGFLYVQHVSKLKGQASQPTVEGWLSNSFFHPAHGSLPGFVMARSVGVFQYLFGQAAVGDAAFLMFLAGVVLLLGGRRLADQTVPPRLVAILLLLPFVLNAGAAIARVYPYGGSRHSVFLAMFAIAGVSLTIAYAARRHPTWAFGSAAVIVALCGLLGAPRRPYMLRADQKPIHMAQALASIHHQVPPGGRIFIDFQTNFLARYYLCPEADTASLPFVAGFKSYQCGGYQITTTSPETNILTAEIFPEKWREFILQEKLKPGAAIWVFQAGWDIDLADGLGRKFPEFRALDVQSFGRNITLFKLTVEQPMPAI